MKLTHAQVRAHEKASRILSKPKLSIDERRFVLENWHPGARHINTVSAAHFTPVGLALDLSVEITDGDLVDLCAGIGTLAFFARQKCQSHRRLVCVEINPDYVEVGRKTVPEADWHCADVFSLPKLGTFHTAISNMPWGATRRTGNAPRYTGPKFEYHVIDIASELARDGVFLIPQQSSPFLYSGQQYYKELPAEKIPHYTEFSRATHIRLVHNCGLNTEVHRSEWRDVSPQTEIVLAEFDEARAERHRGTTVDLFSDDTRQTTSSKVA